MELQSKYYDDEFTHFFVIEMDHDGVSIISDSEDSEDYSKPRYLRFKTRNELQIFIDHLVSLRDKYYNQM